MGELDEDSIGSSRPRPPAWLPQRRARRAQRREGGWPKAAGSSRPAGHRRALLADRADQTGCRRKSQNRRSARPLRGRRPDATKARTGKPFSKRLSTAGAAVRPAADVTSTRGLVWVWDTVMGCPLRLDAACQLYPILHRGHGGLPACGPIIGGDGSARRHVRSLRPAQATYRLLLIFVVTILVPGLVLGFLGLRALLQERQLADQQVR